MSRALIVSDGKPGHINQSVALTGYMDISYDMYDVTPRYWWSKTASYLLDNMGIVTKMLFDEANLPHEQYDYVIGAGSETYYMTKVLAKRYGAKSVSMMLPRGYRYDLDVIFAQAHDKPPLQSNIIEIPANFAYVRPQGLYRASKLAVGIIIGGNNRVFNMSKSLLKEQLDAIVSQYHGYEIVVTTSPRTPEAIEEMIEAYAFDYSVIYSKNPINPIPDFLDQCETVFITSDSTSMISEAVSYGSANVMVLPLKTEDENKFDRLIGTLAEGGYLWVFDGRFQNANRKIDFSQYAAKVYA